MSGRQRAECAPAPEGRDGGSYEFLDAVTSDLCFAARGPDPEAVFTACAEALLAATVEQPGAVRASEELALRLEEPDLELLLLRFLNELVFLRDARGRLLRVRRLHIERDGAARLEAVLCGEPMDRSRHRPAAEVKAATAHGLRLAGDERAGYEARVTLDV